MKENMYYTNETKENNSLKKNKNKEIIYLEVKKPITIKIEYIEKGNNSNIFTVDKTFPVGSKFILEFYGTKTINGKEYDILCGDFKEELNLSYKEKIFIPNSFLFESEKVEEEKKNFYIEVNGGDGWKKIK